MTLAHIALGSNLGDRARNLAEALRLMAEAGGMAPAGKSRVLETAPVEYTAQPFFLNQVVTIETERAPLDLLRALQEIENRMGRVREIPKGPRVIDLDILLYGSAIVHEPELVIPHPAIKQRQFVLELLLELDPCLVDPASGRPFADFLTGKSIDRR